MSIYSYIPIILLLAFAIIIFVPNKSHTNISNKPNYNDITSITNDACSLSYMNAMQRELQWAANAYPTTYGQHSEMGPIYGGSSLSPTVNNSNSTFQEASSKFNEAYTKRKGSHTAKCLYCGNKTDNLFKCNSCGGLIE